MAKKKFSWVDEIDLYFHYAKMEGKHVQRDPVSENELSDFYKNVGFPFDQEFTDLYMVANGFGHDLDGDIWWKISPLDQISQMIKEARNWFEEYHPTLAERFYPFIDWRCGDYTGFLIGENGQKMKGLYTFYHGELEYDEEQDSEEFLNRSYLSILEYVR